MKTFKLFGFCVAFGAAAFFGFGGPVLGQGTSANKPPVFRNLNAVQQAYFDAIPVELTQAAAAARAALTAASLAEPPDPARVSSAAQRLADAELALALAQADAFARVQSSPDRLAVTQLALLIQAAAGTGRGGRGGAAAAADATAVPRVPGYVRADDAAVGYMGRWDRQPSAATTVNSGASILFRFRGSSLKGLFQTTTAASQIYVTIDGGEKKLYTVDAPEIDFAPTALPAGDHVVEIETKDVAQNVNRWVPPLAAALVFTGFNVGSGEALPIAPALTGRWSPNALRIEFFGDSITQGIRAISMATDPSGTDGTRTYSYLTALALNANITQVGFGAQGVTRGGGGGVPAAGESFYYNFAGSMTDPRAQAPDIVVINQGTNDGGVSASAFEPMYLACLTRIRRAYPNALIAAMRPFNGSQDAAVYSAVERMRDPRIIYIDTDGWLELTNSPDYTEQPTGLHPSLAGHAKAAKLLTEALRGRR